MRPRPLAPALLALGLITSLAGCPYPHTPPGHDADAAEWSYTGASVGFVFGGGKVFTATRWRGDTVQTIARNFYAVPVTIDFDLAVENLYGRTTGQAVVLPPGGETLVLTRLAPIDRGRRWRFDLRWQGCFGDPKTMPSDYVYALPLPPGVQSTVIQGFGGAFTHTGELQWAIDFRLPEGTPVVAMREGNVVAWNDRATGHGLTAEYKLHANVNWAIVRHADGSLARYLHLEPGSVRGGPVRRGEAFARSGFTGYATEPHLHVDLIGAVTGDRIRTYPFVVRTTPASHDGERLVEGATYTGFERPDGAP